MTRHLASPTIARLTQRPVNDWKTHVFKPRIQPSHCHDRHYDPHRLDAAILGFRVNKSTTSQVASLGGFFVSAGDNELSRRSVDLARFPGQGSKATPRPPFLEVLRSRNSASLVRLGRPSNSSFCSKTETQILQRPTTVLKTSSNQESLSCRVFKLMTPRFEMAHRVKESICPYRTS